MCPMPCGPCLPDSLITYVAPNKEIIPYGQVSIPSVAFLGSNKVAEFFSEYRGVGGINPSLLSFPEVSMKVAFCTTHSSQTKEGLVQGSSFGTCGMSGSCEGHLYLACHSVFALNGGPC